MDDGHQRSFWDDYMSMSEDSDDDTLQLHQPSPDLPVPEWPDGGRLGELLTDIRRRSPLPRWRGVEMAHFQLGTPPTAREWAAIDIAMEFVDDNIVLYCSVPRDRETEWSLVLALYAAQVCEEILQDESPTIRRKLDELAKKLGNQRGVALGIIFMQLWAHDREAGISKLGVFDRFIVYMLQGDGEVKRATLMYAYKNLY